MQRRESLCVFWGEGLWVGFMRLRPKFVPNHHHQVLLMICKLAEHFRQETRLGAPPVAGGTPSHILGHLVQCLDPHQPWNSLRAPHSPPGVFPRIPCTDLTPLVS